MAGKDMRGLGAFPPEALLAGYPERIADLAEELRAIVRQAVPGSIEAFRPGWRVIGYNLTVGRRTPFFAWLMVQVEHVHLGFPQGILIDDPAHLLDGAGVTKRARWLTAVPGEELAVGPFVHFATEAARIAGLTPSEQQAIRFEREAQVFDSNSR